MDSRELSELSSFGWQTGYGAFSVSVSGVEEVKIYILNQKEHHRTRTLLDRLRALILVRTKNKQKLPDRSGARLTAISRRVLWLTGGVANVPRRPNRVQGPWARQPCKPASRPLGGDMFAFAAGRPRMS